MADNWTAEDERRYRAGVEAADVPANIRSYMLDEESFPDDEHVAQARPDAQRDAMDAETAAAESHPQRDALVDDAIWQAVLKHEANLPQGGRRGYAEGGETEEGDADTDSGLPSGLTLTGQKVPAAEPHAALPPGLTLTGQKVPAAPAAALPPGLTLTGQKVPPQWTETNPFVPKTTAEAVNFSLDAPAGAWMRHPKTGELFQREPPKTAPGATGESSANLTPEQQAIDFTGMPGIKAKPKPPGLLAVGAEALKKGVTSGVTESLQAATPFRDRPAPEPDTSPVGKLLQEDITEGWSSPKWWVAHMAHGAAASSPSLALGAVGAAAGAAAGAPTGVGAPIGGLIGGAGGFALGSAIQTIAPAYQKARQDGLDHDAAVTRAIEETGIASAFGGAMGLAPGFAIFGRTAAGALKRPISEALAQIFGVQPGLGIAQQAATSAVEGKNITPAEAGTTYAEQVGMGGIMFGGHAALRAATGHGQAPAGDTNPPPETEPPPPGAPQGTPPTAPTVGDRFDTPAGPMTVSQITTNGDVVLTDGEGRNYPVPPTTVAALRRSPPEAPAPAAEAPPPTPPAPPPPAVEPPPAASQPAGGEVMANLPKTEAEIEAGPEAERAKLEAVVKGLPPEAAGAVAPPVEAQPPAAPPVVRPEAELPPGGFQTAKGSVYEAHEDGTTTRNKSFHPEHGAADQGPQPRSEATFYVSPEDAQRLGEIQSVGGPARIIAPVGDGRWGVKYLEGKDAGKFEARTVVAPASDRPATGLTPVEVFNGGQRVHFGNEITRVGPEPPPAAGENPVPPTERPIPEAPPPNTDESRYNQARSQIEAIGTGGRITLGSLRSELKIKSETEWSALVSRLEQDGLITPKPNKQGQRTILRTEPRGEAGGQKETPALPTATEGERQRLTPGEVISAGNGDQALREKFDEQVKRHQAFTSDFAKRFEQNPNFEFTKDNHTYFASRDLNGENPWRLTHFLDGEPTGHIELRTPEEVAQEAWRLTGQGYEVRERAAPAVEKSVEAGDNVTRVTPAAGETARQPIAFRPIRDTTDPAFIPSTGASFPIQYAIVEARDLITSHHDDLSPNRDYPQALQPRSRERAETEAQLSGILNGDPRDPNATFRPELLGENPDAANGSPIIGPEGYVESGNARTMAIRRAYDRDLPQAQAYRAALEAQGYPTEGVEQPVLVRINRAEMDMPAREQLARDLNVAPQATMSASDRAMADAQQIPGDLLRLYSGGDIFSAANRAFWKGILDRIAKPSELPTMTNPEGGLSPAGQTRVKNALLAKAYGDKDFVTALTEDADSNIKAIGNALNDAAPHWARLRDAVADGRVSAEYDLTSPLIEAVRLIQHARDEGRNVVEYMNQRGLFGEGVSAETESLLRWMLGPPEWSRRHGREKIADTMVEYADSVLRPLRLGETRAAAPLLVENAREVAHGAAGDLFASPLGEPGSAAAVREGAGQSRPEAPGRKVDTAGADAPENRQAEAAGAERVAQETDWLGRQETAAPPAESPTRKIEDAGEKIGGARKDRWAQRALSLADLEGMTGGEESKYVTKNAVWPQPDYAALIKAGMEPQTAALLKILRDKLAAKPSRDTPEGRRNYIEMMGHVREAFEAAKTPADLKAARDQIIYERLGWPRVSYAMPDKTIREKLFSIFTGRKEHLGVGREDERKAEALVKSGWPAEPEEPWLRGVEFRPEPSFRTTSGDGFKEGPPRTAVYKNGKYVRMFETEDAARDFLREQHEHRGKDREEGKLPERPHLDNLERTGPDVRQGRDVDSPDFVKDFGFRGVEFGNWVAGDERQKAINLAYDGLHDLADTLGIDPKALSLDGQLGLAFGARGSGRAAAHYEPEKMVINLTKLSGAGSLAHEWGHALDHYLGELDRPDANQGAARGATGWYEQRDYTGRKPLANLRPELAQAVDGLMSALFKRERNRAEVVRDQELEIEKTQAEIEQQQKRVALAKEQAEKYPSQAKSSTKFERDSQAWIAQRERVLESMKKRLADYRGEGDLPTNRVDSSYYQHARALSGKSGSSGYWARPTEMFARAFEAYVFDKIAAKERASQYLVQGVEGERYKIPPFKGNPYPVGMEREAINAAFDNLVGTLETRQGKSGLPALHEGDEPTQGVLTPARNVTENLQSWRRTFADGPVGSHEAARDFVVTYGRSTGHEYFGGVDPTTGRIVDAGTSDHPSQIMFNDATMERLWAPGGEAMDYHHNHPSSLSLSTPDLAMLAAPNLRWIIAHGHDGDLLSAAQLTPEARPWLDGMTPKRQQESLLELSMIASDIVERGFGGPVISKRITPEQANAWVREASLAALDGAGALDYMSTRALPAWAYPYALRAARQLRQYLPWKSDPEVIFDRVHRSAGEIRPEAAMARLSGADEGAAAAGRPAGERGDQGSGARPEAEAQPTVGRLAEEPRSARNGERDESPRVTEEDERLAERIARAPAEGGGGGEIPPDGGGAGGNPPAEPERRRADLDRIMHTDSRSMLDRLRETIARVRESGLNGFRQYWQDELASLEKQEKSIHGGELAPAHLSPTLATRFAKNWRSTLDVALNHSQVRYNTETGVMEPVEGSKPLREIFGQVSELQRETGKPAVSDFALWSIVKRAERLMAEGREHNVPPGMIQRYRNLDQLYQRPDGTNPFREIDQEVQGWHKNLLDLGEAAGIVNRDSRALWEHDDYTPFYRALEDEKTAGPGAGGRGVFNVRSPIRHLEGGESKVNNIYENTVLNAAAMLRRSMANIAAQKTRNELLLNTDALVPMSREARVPYGDPVVQQSLRAAGLDPQRLNDAAKDGARDLFGALKQRDPDVISVMDNGKASYYRVKDPLLLQSLTAAGPQTMTGVASLLTAPARLLRGAVVFDPAFMVAHNLRMAQHAYILTGTSPIASIGEALRQAKGIDPIALKLMTAGAMSGKYDIDLPKRIRTEIASPEYQRSLIDTPLKAARFIHEVAEKAMHASDIGPRVALYKRAIAQNASEADAINQARDLLDFSTRGAGGAAMFLAQTIPFLNARWQGMARSGRGFLGPDRNAILMRGALVTAATIALWMQNKDDPEYQRKEDWDKQYAYQIKVGDQWFRLPIAFELGALFSSVPMMMLDYMDNGSSRQLQNAAGSLFANVFKFNPIPVAIRPALETWWNHDSLTGRPIVNEREQALEPDLQYGPADSPAVVALTQAYNSVSPAQVAPANVQHLLRGYLAGWGTYIAQAADFLGEQAGALPAHAAPATTPIIGRFLRGEPEPGNRLMNDFYDLKHQIAAVGLSMKEGQKNQDTALVAQLRAKHPEFSPALESAMNRAGKQLSDIRGVYAHTEANPGLSAERKTAARDTYYRSRDRIMDSLKPLLRKAEGLNP